ncbi:hypothetical protein GVN16_25145 [Emticicia sp. CRIBPO]|uniref:DUF4175 family protein n=1 Tax=Emticicia sp. CRIBPO TaxID=2683258 RepID=UPI001412C28F|nr:DUF4175 family protein [Emticicia sp. CRIBPO]NBA89088.1 hypothetical protein [Emticicia sp. CRIBPO]
MKEINKIISGVNFQLHGAALLKSLFCGAAAFLLISAFTPAVVWSAVAGLAVFAAAAYLTGLFKDKKQEAVRLIHRTIGDTEYSLPLLEVEQPNLAEQLQLERLLTKIQGHQIPNVLSSRLGIYLLAFTAALAVHFGYPLLSKKQSATGSIFSELQPDKKVNEALPPKFASARLGIYPPAYTGIAAKETDELNASAITGSVLRWRVKFDHSKQLVMKLSNNRGEELPFKLHDGTFEYSDHLLNSGLYALKAYWKDSLVYQSDYYRLEAIPDLAPKIEPASKELYRYHFLKDPKTIQISAKISDDFLVSQAFIVATLARGSGENVKFREVRFPVGQANFKTASVSKTIDLKALNFAPGDELYYYWGAVDNKRPEPNFTKSDTYFIVYKDTSATEEGDLATMAMNIMPEYFRSQRQIIIDTEKLIAKRKKMDKKEFNSTSNEIGFDQKALRLRYGQYLGEEFENSIGGGAALPPGGGGSNSTADLLKGFVHAHDEGEHDTEPGGGHEHEHEHGGSKTMNEDKDPVAALLEDYVHSHDDGEANTFYEESTRSLLKMALEQMWQSELHLRLYEPEKALPFEKKALEFLKSAQHKARTFVKKTSFDPPPIKEKEKRLTGELTKFNDKYSVEKVLTKVQLEKLVAEVLGILDTQQANQKLGAVQKQKVLTLGTYLSHKAVNSSLSSWSVLTLLQKIINDKSLSEDEQSELKTKMYALTGTGLPGNLPGKSYSSEKRLEKAFWKNLQ